MAHRILLGTRKGTVVLDRSGAGWRAGPIAHAGISVSFAAQDPRDGTLWAALDHGHWGPKLSRSRDGGATWEDAPSIKYPDGARFVARTQDGGATWQQFREGLPQEDAYDLVYRHALDARGDTVCFGSTTGNVYLSGDRGETWSCLGNNVPPVHSVRFA